jgi:hypothetical protein
MSDAPIALFAYNRPAHLAEALESLRGLSPPLLYVFCDGPRNTGEESAVAGVRALVEAIDWTDVRPVYRRQNLGLNRSIGEGLDAVFERHDRAIVIEDDVCVAPEFGAFAMACLDAYANEPRVAAITGMRYPFPLDAVGEYPYSAFFAPRFSSWGWATWRRAWQGFSRDVGEVAERVEAAGLRDHEMPGDMPEMLRALRSGRLRGGWDVCLALSILAARQEVVWPTWNMVVNVGFESGTHAGSAPAWDPQFERAPTGPLKVPPPHALLSEPRQALLKMLHEHMLIRDAEAPESAYARLWRVVRRGLITS